ncbi:hypothetical protein SAMN05443248_0239 [Bradyrhizobium erythrophlei]|uniref:Uncharacterized protein n=1 Tax=Bradyrhizobium erythrophlei TaxID=1437360 RepID=A0A1M5GYY9_9BRAD|nr:hypothetical protein SAMN05443248_0239 [Bradyrhizobium erythrophlei]
MFKYHTTKLNFRHASLDQAAPFESNSPLSKPELCPLVIVGWLVVLALAFL